MSDTSDILYIDRDKAYCEGGLGALGHPKVFLALNHEGKVDCPYCGKRFQSRATKPKRAVILDDDLDDIDLPLSTQR